MLALSTDLPPFLASGWLNAITQFVPRSAIPRRQAKPSGHCKQMGCAHDFYGGWVGGAAFRCQLKVQISGSGPCGIVNQARLRSAVVLLPGYQRGHRIRGRVVLCQAGQNLLSRTQPSRAECWTHFRNNVV